MIHTTKGIVLKTVKYGETSVIVSIFTELFGIQSYLVNGVRTSSKSSKAFYFQPASLLEMQVYHNELKNLQRIRDLKWSALYKSLYNDVVKNNVALFMVELIYKNLKQPETNVELFQFAEDAFLTLDAAGRGVTANFAMYFAIQLAQVLGFRLTNNYSSTEFIFNTAEGIFETENAGNATQADQQSSLYISRLLQSTDVESVGMLKMNRNARMNVLKILEAFYSWHIPEFGTMKTLAVLSEILA